MKTKKKGFTLIEMLVVITIIGILSTLILVSVGRIRKNSIDTRRKANLENVRGAIAIYYSATSSWPAYTDWNSLITTLSNSGYISDNIKADEDDDGIIDYQLCTCGEDCSGFGDCSTGTHMKLTAKCTVETGEGCNDTTNCQAGYVCLDVK